MSTPDEEWAAWQARNAAQVRRALANPEVRAELLALLGMDDDGRERERRLQAAREELDALTLRWRDLEEREP
jgi:hypothetical protein